MTRPTRLTRRDVLKLFALACAGTGLQACSGRSTAPAASAQTRVVTDIEDRPITVPEHPTRVVALSEPTLDNLLALGITPIGTVAGRGQMTAPNYLADRVRDVPLLGNIGQPNFEAIGAQQPDLIFVDGTSVNNNPPVVAALEQIAPVVYTGWAGGDWRVNLRITAAALNMQDEGEAVIEDYEAHVAKVQAQLQDYRDATFSVVRWQGSSASLILKELPAGRALTDLGLRRPPVQDREGRGHSDPVSLENLRDIDADYIFFGTLGGSAVTNPQAGGSAGVEDAKQAILQARDLPGFQQLQAFQQNHIIPVDGSVWTSAGGPLLMNRIVSDVAEFLV
ncbi:ABC transporter substrate-binding protein [Corynebacterium sp. HS2168-gen11]|uniref:ABC transporter substrate-binding protein n=1 Tax=Corynebacterium sp. HS2168-gen11 TaxID=2974027 RepID=UPI00216B5E5D|nr:ABC transporter substrate-binding protein [Corynebacterium sp. HS2168-gen11]MCS4535691.1 ABC transporter substrate-binding protein [Corynebacterium sp. HS2168-gen11]